MLMLVKMDVDLNKISFYFSDATVNQLINKTFYCHRIESIKINSCIYVIFVHFKTGINKGKQNL